MKKVILLYLLLSAYLSGFAQAPSNDECANAIVINDAKSYCSAVNQYSNLNSTTNTTTGGPDVWFKFIAVNFEVKITVTGGSLTAPVIKMQNECGLVYRVGSSFQDGNITIFNDAGLVPGKPYYISVSGANTGTFKLCIENYQSEIRPGQDYPSSSLLCSTESTVRAVNITGAGSNTNETAGTCLGEEKHTAWYKWTAENSGTLVFTITPNRVDDIDWALFDLGPEGSPKTPSASNVIRCAAGHGISNAGCPNEPTYTKTGLDFNETDTQEEGGCGSGQNGIVRAITMVQGHVYALLVNNFTDGNNGFELVFKDKAGMAGTGLFKGPKPKLNQTSANLCTPQQSFTFNGSASSNYSGIKWYFGEGASIPEADTPGPFTITYSTYGTKTVVLQAKSSEGCSVVETFTFTVGLQPDVPVVSANQPKYCISETIRLTTQDQANVTYLWTGPNNFTSTLRSPEIPITSTAVAGVYTLIASRGTCQAAAATVTIPAIDNPIAAFRADPKIPAKLAFPIKIRFFNESKDADSYLWEFGDGETSSETNPEHTYIGTGNFEVKLTAYKSTTCSTSISQGNLIVGVAGAIFIPNTFTPNNDSANDEFVVNMNNIRTYRINIYNRYGVQVYTSGDLVENWDGTYKNEPVPVGTYYYVINALDYNNNVIKKSGSVTILR